MEIKENSIFYLTKKILPKMYVCVIIYNNQNVLYIIRMC